VRGIAAAVLFAAIPASAADAPETTAEFLQLCAGAVMGEECVERYLEATAANALFAEATGGDAACPDAPSLALPYEQMLGRLRVQIAPVLVWLNKRPDLAQRSYVDSIDAALSDLYPLCRPSAK